jgi:hypothetical protein
MVIRLFPVHVDEADTVTQTSAPVSFVNGNATYGTFGPLDPGHVFGVSQDDAIPSMVNVPLCWRAEVPTSPQNGPTGIAPKTGAENKATGKRIAANDRRERRAKTSISSSDKPPVL